MWNRHIKELRDELNRKSGMISRIQSKIAGVCLLPVVYGLCISKIWYALPVYGSVRITEEEPKCGAIQNVQISLNKILRKIGKLKQREISVRDLMGHFRVLSVNQMTAQAILTEAWKMLAFDLPGKEKIVFQRQIPMQTRSQFRGDLHSSKPFV